MISRLSDALAQYQILLKWTAVDLVRKRGMRWLSLAKLLQYFVLRLSRNQRCLDYLLAAHRYHPGAFVTNTILREGQAISDGVHMLVEDAGPDEARRAVRRTLILKNPIIHDGRIEKGVLLISFTATFAYFHKHVDCERLLRYFYVVLEPSWSGYAEPNILFWTRYKPHTVIVQATDANDYSFLTSLKSNLVPIPIGASDWVNPRLFYPLPEVEKQYDAVYVTNYNPLKRHHVLLETLRRLNDPTFRVAMVCGDNGDARSEILQLIRHFDVGRNLTLFDSIPQKDLNVVLNASKVNMLLSLKEGSNRSIFEGFFANVPGIVLRRNRGVRKDYINAMTGRLIDEEDLLRTLLHFRDQWSHYRPREWALANISPSVTTEKLSELLKDIARSNREAWSEGLVPKVNSPEVAYLNPDDDRRMLESRAIISLFSQNTAGRNENDDILESSLKRICSGRSYGRGPAVSD